MELHPAQNPIENTGFILPRHVCSETSNQLWQECLYRIRLFYPTLPVIIIDDNSCSEYVTPTPYDDTNLYIIQSEFPGRAELLPYYYLLNTPAGVPVLEKAVILHDSVFLSRPINEEILQTKEMAFLWHFPHWYDLEDQELVLLKKLNMNDDFLEYWRHKQYWFGCFGVQSVITRTFLQKLETKYRLIESLKDLILNRNDRMNLERVFAVICTYECHTLQYEQSCSLWGNIFHYTWGVKWQDYLADKEKYYQSCPMVKVWSDR